MPRVVALAVAAFSLVAGGCKDVAPPLVCPADPAPAIVANLVDSLSGSPVLSPSEVVASDGAYADTVRGPPQPFAEGWASLAFERPGTYRVQATAEGYRPWVKDGVRAAADECGVQTVEIEALMQPSEGG